MADFSSYHYFALVIAMVGDKHLSQFIKIFKDDTENASEQELFAAIYVTKSYISNFSTGMPTST